MLVFSQNKGAKLAKIESRWEFGICVGVRRRSNELIVSDFDGLHSVRSVRKIPYGKLGKDCLNFVVWAPWHRYKGAWDASGDAPTFLELMQRCITQTAGEVHDKIAELDH